MGKAASYFTRSSLEAQNSLSVGNAPRIHSLPAG
jgi:hypothetical protein